jgi:hypothetical protein
LAHSNEEINRERDIGYTTRDDARNACRRSCLGCGARDHEETGEALLLLEQPRIVLAEVIDRSDPLKRRRAPVPMPKKRLVAPSRYRGTSRSEASVGDDDTDAYEDDFVHKTKPIATIDRADNSAFHAQFICRRGAVCIMHPHAFFFQPGMGEIEGVPHKRVGERFDHCDDECRPPLTREDSKR